MSAPGKSKPNVAADETAAAKYKVHRHTADFVNNMVAGTSGQKDAAVRFIGSVANFSSGGDRFERLGLLYAASE